MQVRFIALTKIQRRNLSSLTIKFVMKGYFAPILLSLISINMNLREISDLEDDINKLIVDYNEYKFCVERFVILVKRISFRYNVAYRLNHRRKRGNKSPESAA